MPVEFYVKKRSGSKDDYRTGAIAADGTVKLHFATVPSQQEARRLADGAVEVSFRLGSKGADHNITVKPDEHLVIFVEEQHDEKAKTPKRADEAELRRSVASKSEPVKKAKRKTKKKA